MTDPWSNLDGRAANAARLLAVDAVEAAQSGHPGAAISLAPVAHLLFQRTMRHDPRDPDWVGRDRFVLSCGHASMLLYAQLYLSGYDLEIDDLAAFRRLHSRTPGHPERGVTAGVDASTGPLGQGIAMAVGMAMAFKHQRAVYDPNAAVGESPFDRRVWVIASDGDLQEGASYEAGALAGRQQLDNLTVIYDDNGIQIEGSTSLAWDEDVPARFSAQRWRVSVVGRAARGDVDVAGVDRAIAAADGDPRPHLIVLKSEIAWPAPTARGTAGAHSGALGADEVRRLREVTGSPATPFEVEADVLGYTRRAIDRGQSLHASWNDAMERWERENPDLAEQWRAAQVRELPAGLAAAMPSFEVGSKLATRDASAKVIQALAAQIPELMGGSADLAEANKTLIAASASFLPEGDGRLGRNIHWGVRELGMTAALNGMLLAGGVRAFAATFLVFSDFQRPAVRLAALMNLPAIYVWTHDSVAVGPDGPTHQPIEQLPSLRAMPGLTLIRPADARETVAAWLVALEQEGPTGLVLCRQPLPTLDQPSATTLAGVRRGAYVLSGDLDASLLLIATGSEVGLALAAATEVRAAGVKVRVVSMPSREIFERQDAAYRDSVLPPRLTQRVVIEAAATFGWRDIAGDRGVVVGIDEFGLSGGGDDVPRAFGMTVERVLEAIETVRAQA